MVRRVLLFVPTLVGMSILTFGVSNLTPGDPAFAFASRLASRPATPEEVAQARHDLGLEGGLVPRYFRWVGRAAQGDLGISFSTRLPVRPELAKDARYTLQLAVPAAPTTQDVTLPLAVLGGLISSYHILLERYPSLESGVCEAANPCTLIWVRRFGYLTIPAMALSAFAFITVLVLTAAYERVEEAERTDPCTDSEELEAA